VMDFTNRYRCKDGSYRYLQWISRPIKTRGLTYAIARDITKQKKQQEELQLINEEIKAMNEKLHSQNEELYDLYNTIKESEETYRNIFQNAHVGLFRTRISDGKILESNEQMAEMFGYANRVELIAEYLTSENYVDPGTREKMITSIKKKGFVKNFEARFYRKDKSIFWARYSARIYPDKGWIEGVVEDITDQKKSEEALKREKEWSENIVNNAPNIVVGLGENSQIIVFNHYAERLTGYQAEEVIGREWIKIFIPEELRETIYRVWNEIVENKFIDHHFENEVISRSGERRLIEWNNTILTEDGEFRMILSLGEDITERKQAIEALRISEDRLSKIMLAANDGMWDWDLTSNEVYFDPRYYKMSGYEIDEFPHRLEEFQKRIHPDDVDYVMSNAEQHLKGEIERFQVEFRFQMKHGGWMWIAGRGYIVERDEEGTPLRFVGTHRDITDRREAEDALRDSNAKNTAILSASPDLMFINDQNGIFLDYYTNDDSLLMIKPESFLGKSIDEVLPQIAEQSRQCYKNAFASKQLQIFEYTLDLPGGNRYFEARINAMSEQRILTIIRDVTKRKLAEAALKESEEKYRSIFENISEGLIYTDMKGKVIETNDALIKIVNIDKKNLIGKTIMNLAKKILDPKHLPLLTENINQVLTGNSIDSFILPFKDKFIEISVNINEQNKRIIGILRDVTVEKKAERKSLESHAQLLAIFDGIDEPIYVSDPKTYEIIFVNRVLKSIFGNPDNRKCYQYLQHRNTPCPFCTNEIILGENAGKSYIWEFQNEISNRWYRCIDKAIMWPDGRLVRNEMAIDITERKKSEEEQRRYIKELETIYEISRSLQHNYLPEELAQELIDIMERTLRFEYGAVLLIDDITGKLLPFAVSNQGQDSEFVKADKDYINSHDLTLGKGLTGWVAKTGQSVRLGDVKSDQRYYPIRKDIRSELCVPMRTGDRIIGVLNMETNKINAYSESDQRLLETVATQMALAIQQTQLNERIRQYTVDLEQRVAERTAQLEEKVQKLDQSEKAMIYMVEDLNNLTSELQEERRKLLISNQELEAFTYSVSHDLRAPLRAVDGFGKFLLEDYAEKLDEEGKRYINVIRNNVVKMDRLILDLLSLSRISRADINKTVVDMTAVARSIYCEIASAEEQESFELCISKLPSAVCDLTLIKQVWQNLISNAIKYSTKSEIKKIEIGASKNEKEFIFWIKDYGAGFDDKYLEKLFGVFQRLHKE
ncbi:MAG: PAS domain S-box protein, partial [Candidatus Cloacimonetes bacterium]|nr:PAS domain S-box protein [Candidatus Cloacimonadota bacterium]